MSNMLDALRWRYATKKFDPLRKLSELQVDDLVEATRLSASSYGLQPYGFALVRDPEVRARLREVSYGQPQITDASHLMVFATRTNLSREHVDAYMQRVAETRQVQIGQLAGFAQNIQAKIDAAGPEGATEWATRQLYIAVGFLLAAAAQMGVDSCPMEGFQIAGYDEILGLPEHGLSARVVVALGHRSEEDPLASMAKVRTSRTELFLEI